MKRLIWSAAALCVVLLVAGAWLVLRLSAHFRDPSPSATPEQVVRTYVAAVNARDFDTARTIAPNGWTFHRWWPAPRMTHLRLLEKTADTDESGMGSQYRYAWYVPVEFHLTGGDISMPDGQTSWGYVVARNSEQDPWRIIDQGVG